MRKNVAPQLGLVSQIIDHPHARELVRISEVLDKLPQAAELIAKDLAKGTKASEAGRGGMSGEQVLRAALLKQTHGWSYTEPAFHLADSPTFRGFCRIGMLEQAPRKSALAENIKRVKPETFEQVNRLVVGRAKKEGVEDGKKSRIDSTVVDANIHHPLDSNLLFDVVRVLTRILGHSAEPSSRINHKQHKKLQPFRAGVEGIISFTKRCFGFGRCLWRGYRSFHAYARESVLCTNLLLMARKTMA